MEAIFTTITDKQRVETLYSVYQKGLTTPKEKLAFSADKLVYLKPFLAKLQDTEATDLSSRIMVRQVVDQLLQDIVDEISATCSRANVAANRVATEYGLNVLMSTSTEEFYLTKQVA
ncbi:MAG: hypothetical protein RL226_1077 [Bacteroidota bacterium]|jgi:predicted metal-dependent phosphotriesterase family hydrolase